MMPRGIRLTIVGSGGKGGDDDGDVSDRDREDDGVELQIVMSVTPAVSLSRDLVVVLDIICQRQLTLMGHIGRQQQFSRRGGRGAYGTDGKSFSRKGGRDGEGMDCSMSSLLVVSRKYAASGCLHSCQGQVQFHCCSPSMTGSQDGAPQSHKTVV